MMGVSCTDKFELVPSKLMRCPCDRWLLLGEFSAEAHEPDVESMLSRLLL